MMLNLRGKITKFRANRERDSACYHSSVAEAARSWMPSGGVSFAIFTYPAVIEG